MAFDLVVRGGTVVDGSGAPGFRADVGVRGGRIVEVGRIADGGDREIDADGHVVCPGFIDGHTHMDAQVLWDPLGSCSCWHGVTTVVMGNCGFTIAPGSSSQRALVIRNLERAEDISAEALDAGIDWTWETFPEYLDAVDARPKAINYAAFVGHSALRTWVMGERAFSEPATDRDMEGMTAALLDSLGAGAVGLSTSRSVHHETSDDRPVASRQATWDEVRRLVGSMGAAGGGVFELAMEPNSRSPDPAERAEFFGRLCDLAVTSGTTVTFGILPSTLEGGEWRSMLGALDATERAGGRMYGQSHSRGVNSVLSFKTALPFDKLPEWAEVRALPVDVQRKVFQDPSSRRRLVEAARHGQYGRSIGAEARAPQYDTMRVLDRGLPPNPSVADLAAARGVDPVDLIIDLGLASHLDQLFIQPLGVVDDAALLEIMRHPRTAMTFSDSGAHVSQIIDASIHTHLLGHWVREARELTLEAAIRMITSVPASIWGLSDRGLVAAGKVADLNVFDPERIAPELPKVVPDLPGGALRLVQRSTGIRATVVAGETIVHQGQETGALPGRLLRSRSV